MIPHRGVVRLVRGCDFVELGSEQTILQLAPLSFDASTFEIWGALLNGGTLAIEPALHPSLDDIAAAIARYSVTTLWLTASLFNLMVDHRLAALRPLRQLIVGGDVLSPAHVDAALRALPSCRIVNGYGPTENTTFTCCYTIPRHGRPEGGIPIGKPIHGTQIHILDEAMRPVPDGGEGELYAGGDGVALGYLNRPDLTAEKFVADPWSPVPGARLYRTGDRVRRLPDGKIEFRGRTDRQIKLNGKRVELDEIEACLRRSPLVRDAAVVSPLDASGRRNIAAFVAPVPGSLCRPAELRSFLRRELPDFMVPGRIELLDALPLTPSGKLDRASLAATTATPGFDPARSNDTETALQRIWRGVLGQPHIDRADNFFDLGCTSLHMIEAHAKIGEAFDRPVSLLDLFGNPSIRDLAALLDGKAAGKPELFTANDRAGRRNLALGRARSAQRERVL